MMTTRDVADAPTGATRKEGLTVDPMARRPSLAEGLPIIWVVGMPRSGTTWIGKIFDSHPDTLYRHEADSVGPMKALPRILDLNEVSTYRETVQDFALNLPRIRAVRVCAKLPVFPKSYYSAIQFAAWQLCARAAQIPGRLSAELPVPQFADYRRVPQIRLVWKSIASFGRLGAITEILQQCRTIVLLRHPCGIAASRVRGRHEGLATSTARGNSDQHDQLFQLPYATSRGLTLEEFKRLQPVERVAWRWVLLVEKAMAELGNSERFVVVRYEDVCAAPMERARRLFEFANLSWSAQTEQFVRQSTTVENRSYYSVYKDPARAANKWREELTRDEINRVMAILEKSPAGRLYENV